MQDKTVWIFRNAGKYKVWYMKSDAGKDCKKDKLDERFYTEKEDMLRDINEFLT